MQWTKICPDENLSGHAVLRTRVICLPTQNWSYCVLLAYANHLTYASFGILSSCVRKLGILDFLLTQSGILGLCLHTPRK